MVNFIYIDKNRGGGLSEPRVDLYRIEGIFMIEIKNITVAYQAQTNQSIFVLNDVSTTIETGEWVSIIGSSGSGKTSFLKLIG